MKYSKMFAVLALALVLITPAMFAAETEDAYTPSSFTPLPSPAGGGTKVFETSIATIASVGSIWNSGATGRRGRGDDANLAGTERSLVKFRSVWCWTIAHNMTMSIHADDGSGLLPGAVLASCVVANPADGTFPCAEFECKVAPGIILPNLVWVTMIPDVQNGAFPAGTYAPVNCASVVGLSDPTFFTGGVNNNALPPPWVTLAFAPPTLSNLYNSVFADNTGACCDNNACTVTTAAACSTGTYFGDFTDCVGRTCNDSCAGKGSILDGVTAIDLTPATTDPPLAGDGAAGPMQFWFGDPTIKFDLWYNYTATCTGELRIDSCGAPDRDSRIAIYDDCGTCPPTTVPLDANDDSGGEPSNGDPDGDPDLCNEGAGGGPPFSFAMSTPVTLGSCYKLRIGVYTQSPPTFPQFFEPRGPDNITISCCGNGIAEGTEDCDGGPCCNADCTYVSAGTSCRASAGVCDVAETCTGASGSCPADGFASTGVCRASAGVCDVAESCNGSGVNCPADGFASSGVCRASAGVCDVAESCNGSGVACPADGFASSGTSCRVSAGVCDVAESCTGSGALCPADGFASSGTSCRVSAGVCDVAESCTGSGAACPANGFAAAGTSCRASAGVCDVGESCTGSGAACPADGFASSGVCRASADICDVAESCNGSGTACPADGYAAGGTLCRASAGVCDVAENCTGSGAACPADGYVAGGTLCRADSGEPCDVAENCTGSGVDCPGDVDTTACVDNDDCCPSGCGFSTDNDCEPIPTVSEWGVAILALLLLTAGKIYFGRRPSLA